MRPYKRKRFCSQDRTRKSFSRPPLSPPQNSKFDRYFPKPMISQTNKKDFNSSKVVPSLPLVRLPCKNWSNRESNRVSKNVKSNDHSSHNSSTITIESIANNEIAQACRQLNRIEKPLTTVKRTDLPERMNTFLMYSKNSNSRNHNPIRKSLSSANNDSRKEPSALKNHPIRADKFDKNRPHWWRLSSFI